MEEEPPRSETGASQSMQESWFEVSGQGQPKPSQPEEGTLVPSHSREEMEHLLASAASEEELSDTDLTSAPTFTVPERQVYEGVGTTTGQRERVTAEREKSKSRLRRILSMRGSGIFGGGFLQLLFPVLILTHLAVFGLGFYLGRRISLVKTI